MGKVIGVTLVKNEIDVWLSTLNHMLWHVDHVVVIDNMSDDGTLSVTQHIQNDMPGRITLLHDTEFGHYQSKKMTDAAQFAVDMAGGDIDWIVPFDADEIWYPAPPHQDVRLADHLRAIDPGVQIARAVLYDHVPTKFDNRRLPAIQRIEWRRAEPTPLPKVAFRPTGKFTIQDGNHGVTFHDIDDNEVAAVQIIEVDHFPYRSEAQFIAKARKGSAALEATDLPDYTGAHWRAYGRLTDDQLTEVFETYFSVKNPHDHGDLRWRPAPLKP